MNSWYFFRAINDDEIVLVLDGETKGNVVDLAVGKKVLLLEIKTSTGESFSLSLKDFVLEKNSICQRFREAVKAASRTAFKLLYRKVQCNSEEYGQNSSSEEELSSCSRASVSNEKLPTASILSSTGLQRQLVDDKLLGSCLEVHITNLREPPSSKLSRAVDHQHVKELEISLSKNPEQIVMMYGCVDQWDVTPEDLQRPGGAEVYVIGGNHTRMALQSLVDQGTSTHELVRVNVYRGLSQDDALFLGVHHNQIHNHAKPMSFIEKASLIRKLGANGFHGKKEQELFYRRLQTIFDYETTTKFRHNLKNHIRLARVNSDVWSLIMNVCHSWTRGSIYGQPKKKSIDQTFFVKLLREDIEKQIDLLHTLASNGYKEYLKLLNGNCSKENNESAARDALTTLDKDNTSAPDEERNYLTERIELLEDENLTLKNRVKELEEEVKKLQSKGNKENKRKRNADTDAQMTYAPGSCVEALWKDKNPKATGWYTAIVKGVQEDEYVVEYDDAPGKQFMLNRKHIRPSVR